MAKWYLLFLLICLVAVISEGGKRRGRNKHKHNRHKKNKHVDPFWESAISDNSRWFETANSLSWFESDMHNPFLSSLFSMEVGGSHRNSPWWEGPNICEEKTETVTNATSENEEEIMGHYTHTSNQCDISESSYKCVLIEENIEGKREVTVVYECCHGYSRTEGDFGCPKKLIMKNLIEKAEELGLTEFLQAVKLLELSEILTARNFTMFAPVNGGFGLDTKFINGIGEHIKPVNTKFLQDTPTVIDYTEPGVERTMQTLMSAILGHVVDGTLRSSALSDEQVLETGHFDGGTIRINYWYSPRSPKLMTANCVPVISRDILSTNGVIHTVEQALPPVTESLLEIVKKRSDLTMLKTVLASAEYVPKLQEDGKYTLLAPTDGAFLKMNHRLRERLLNGDKKCIENVLLNHMLPNVICSSAIKRKAHTLNALNKYVHVSRNMDGKIFVNDAQVVSKDIMALNGVIHIIDDVLVPEEALDFIDVLEKEGLTELISLIEMAELTKTLETAKNVTFLAPTNEAIKNLPLGLSSKLVSDKDFLKKVLTYHISPSQLTCSHFFNDQLISTLEGRQIRLNRFSDNPFSRGKRTAQCAQILGKGTKTCNGELNLLSKVMIPPIGSVVDVLASDKRFTTLLSYMKNADLTNMLEGEGPYTVFAPNNEAFEKLDNQTLNDILSQPDGLAQLLKGHIYRRNLCCDGFKRENWFRPSYIYTLASTKYKASRSRQGLPTIKYQGNLEADIVNCDRTANNGMVLEIEQVLVKSPPKKNHHRLYHNQHY